MKEEFDIWVETVLTVITTICSTVAGILPNQGEDLFYGFEY